MKVYFESYGCTLNFGETRMMKEITLSSGHEIVERPIQSDVIVIVTCTVVSHTESMIVRRIRELLKLHRPIVVGGCMASAQPKLLESISDKLILLPPHEIKDIAKKFDEIIKDKIRTDNEVKVEGKRTNCDKKREKRTKKCVMQKVELVELQNVEFQDIEPHKHSEDSLDSFDAIIPICNGCNGECTYCITRLARGKLRSYPFDIIVEQARNALARGQKELRLTAQDTAAYGLDLETGIRLPELVKAISHLGGNDYRIRLGMMNPNTATEIIDGLIDVYKEENVYKFAHIPVQSGDDEILKMMGRRYTSYEYRSLISRLRDAHPELSLSTDVIAGFPGETETQFENTCKLIEEVKPDIINIKGFSPRAGTKAALLPRLHKDIIKSRTKVLTEIRNRISYEKYKGMIGRKVRAFVVEHGKRKDTRMCRTDNYIMVVVKGEYDLGDFVDVEITDATHWYLTGRVL